MAKRVASKLSTNGFQTHHESDHGKYIYVFGGNKHLLEGGYGTVERYVIERDVWEPVEGRMPVSGYGAGAILSKSVIWIIGGCDGTNATLDTVYTYNYVENTWMYHSAMTQRRAYMGVASVGSLIYAFGGHVGLIAQDTVESMNPADGVWEECAPMRKARANCGYYSMLEYIYAYGGIDERFEILLTAERYSTVTLQWTWHIVNTVPGRWAFGLGVIQELVYAIGGDGQGSAICYDANEPARFRRIYNMPRPRTYVTAVVASGILYTVGGITTNPIRAMTNYTESYNPQTQLWAMLGNMASKRVCSAAVVVDFNVPKLYCTISLASCKR